MKIGQFVGSPSGAGSSSAGMCSLLLGNVWHVVCQAVPATVVAMSFCFPQATFAQSWSAGYTAPNVPGVTSPPMTGGAVSSPYYYPGANGYQSPTPITGDGSYAPGGYYSQGTGAVYGPAPTSQAISPTPIPDGGWATYQPGTGQVPVGSTATVPGRLPSPTLPGPSYQSGYASGAKYFQPGGYDARIGSPYYYDGNAQGTITGDPYYDHFGPGFHRNDVHGHYRFPYYTYRAPWYYPGRAVYNRDTNYAW